MQNLTHNVLSTLLTKQNILAHNIFKTVYYVCNHLCRLNKISFLVRTGVCACYIDFVVMLAEQPSSSSISTTTSSVTSMTSLEQEESKGAESVSDYDDVWDTENWGEMDVSILSAHQH
jgi:hypothetical protein